jgi:von Willebrand factor type A domain
MLRLGIVTLLLAIGSDIAHAQQPSCLERTIPVNISISNGSPAPELTAASLEGTYQKRPVLVKSVELEKISPRVILLIDTSGSMQTRAYAEIDVAEEILSRLPPEVEVGLAFFNAETIPVALPNADRRTLIFQLEALKKDPKSFGRKTALWSALIQSAKMFKTPRAGDSVYLISDGGENKSVDPEKTAVRALGSAGIRLFAFILSSGTLARPPEEFAGPIELQNMVNATGGIAVSAAEPAYQNTLPYSHPFARATFAGKSGQLTRLGESLLQQLDQLLKFYRVEVALPESVDKPRDWKLQFNASAGHSKDRFKLTYPTTIWPCR